MLCENVNVFVKRVENTLTYYNVNLILLHDLSSKSANLHKLHHCREEEAFFHKEKWFLN